VKGDITTKYLPEVYPEGFKGKQLKDSERESLVALAACVAVKSSIRDRSFANQKTNSTLSQDYKFQVQLNDFKRNIRVVPTTKDGVKEFQV
jgi:propionyl-CoA carboxylase alpha chain